jgi:hypothetical protein
MNYYKLWLFSYVFQNFYIKVHPIFIVETVIIQWCQFISKHLQKQVHGNKAQTPSQVYGKVKNL